MMKKVLPATILILVIICSYYYYTNHISMMKKDIYFTKSQELKNTLKELILKKHGETSALTYVISQDKNIKNALKLNNNKLISYNKLIDGLETIGNHKDIWVQVIDKNGYSFYRSWTNKIGDSVSNIRVDIAEVIKNPKPMSQISTGRFDMTFKTVIPIYSDDDIFLGIVEMISHFNSIAESLIDKSIQPIMVVDNSYTKKFIKPFTGLFIGENYIANKNASLELMDKIKENGIDNFLYIKDYLIFEDYIVTTYETKNLKNMPMGYHILFSKLNKIDMSKVEEFKVYFLLRLIVALGGLTLIVALILNKRYVKQLNEKVKEKTTDLAKNKDELESLLDSYDKNVIFSRTDLKGNITHVSDAFCHISKYSRDELIGQSHNIVRHPDMPKDAFKTLWDTLKNQESLSLEVKNLKKDGSYYWVMAKFDADYDSNGNHIGYSAIREDITSEKEVESLQKEIEETQKEVVFTMGAIGESRSKETGNHVRRVAEYSKILAKYYNLSEADSELLKQASPMHDIGKVGISDAILNKPGRLTDDERETMNVHASLGYDMLKVSKRPLLKMAATIAYEHHEKWDGTGYPNGLKGEDISIYGRITALADVFDALGSDRCYKKAWDDEKIFSFFKEQKGKHFDPDLVDIFFENLDEFKKVRSHFKDS